MSDPARQPDEHTQRPESGEPSDGLAPRRETFLAMRCGDSAAALGLWQSTAPRLIAAARAMTGSHADALDAVQDAMLSILKLSTDQAAAVTDPAAYLARAVRARAMNITRQRARQINHHTRVCQQKPSPRLVSPEPDVQLERALAALPEQAREVLALKHIAGLTFDQLANVLSLPRGTVVSRHAAALQQLRQVINAPQTSTPPPREAAHA